MKNNNYYLVGLMCVPNSYTLTVNWIAERKAQKPDTFYYDQIVLDTVRLLKRNRVAYLFNTEQVEAVACKCFEIGLEFDCVKSEFYYAVSARKGEN